METPNVVPIARKTFAASEVMKSHPPRLTNHNKKLLYQRAMSGPEPSGTIVVTKWKELPLPKNIPATGCKYTGVKLPFQYDPPKDKTTVEWHLNFADANLFFASGGPLFAQDEMQVGEHPALASIREALLAAKSELTPRTREGGRSTPVLVRGVERRCAVSTDKNAAEGRPNGLYGNWFMSASSEAIQKAVKILDPPTISNIIAIAAQGYQSGRYTFGQINDALSTAYTSFVAARLESKEAVESLGIQNPKVIVHTGYWGCGAFGGNRVVMSLVQLLAARLAGVDEVVFHALGNLDAFNFAVKLLNDQLGCKEGQEVQLSQVINKIVDMNFKWGQSDGN